MTDIGKTTNRTISVSRNAVVFVLLDGASWKVEGASLNGISEGVEQCKSIVWLERKKTSCTTFESLWSITHCGQYVVDMFLIHNFVDKYILCPLSFMP